MNRPSKRQLNQEFLAAYSEYLKALDRCADICDLDERRAVRLKVDAEYEAACKRLREVAR